MRYYKYSDNDLLEDNFPYSGIFHVENNVFLKGYSDLTILSGANTFINNFHASEKNFSNIFTDVDDIEHIQNLPFDTVNKQYFNDIFGTLNDNNLTIFKSLVAINPEIFERSNVRYYTLSSADTPMLLTDGVIHSDSFQNDSTWRFMNDISTGELLPTSEDTFKYLCSNGTELISLSGSFIDNNLSILQRFDLGFTVEIQNISYNQEDDKLQILSDDQILIYDGLLYKNCDNLVLLDSIKLLEVDIETLRWTSKSKFGATKGKFSQKYLKGNPNNPDFIKFGGNYRTSIDSGYLYVLDRFSTRIVNMINLHDFGISDLVTTNVREIDDFVAVIHKKYNAVDGIYITFLESDATDTLSTHKLENITYNSGKYDIEFCNFDSDLFFISSDTQYQIRSIENPEYPLGKISHESFKYLPKFKFGNTYRKFGNPLFKWLSTNMDSNNFNFKSSSNLIIGDISYHAVVATGRFYVIKQKISDFYNYRVSKKLSKTFKHPRCNKSSFGLYLNDNIFSILNDLVALQNQAHCKYEYSKESIHIKQIDDLLIETKNLYLMVNEKIHATNMRRIITNILKIQKEMVSISGIKP